MKVKCECGHSEYLDYTLDNLEQFKKNGAPLFFVCSKCEKETEVLDIIEYEPPTGGTGEVDPFDYGLKSFVKYEGKEAIPSDGMSLRDYFAGQALNGILAGLTNTTSIGKNHPENNENLAIVSCYLADALIKELNK